MPESWRRGPVPRRVLRALDRAYNTSGDSLAVEDLELVDVSTGARLARSAGLESVGGSLVARPRREGVWYYSSSCLGGPPRALGGRELTADARSEGLVATQRSMSERERAARANADRKPRCALAISELVVALVEARRWAAAVDEAVEGLEFLVSGGTPEGRRNAGAALRCAGYFSAAARLDDAVSGLEAKLAGDAAFDAGDYMAALAFYNDPAHPTLLLDRAAAYVKLGNIAAARDAYRDAALAHPDDPRPRLWDMRCCAVIAGCFRDVVILDWPSPKADDLNALSTRIAALDRMLPHVMDSQTEYAAFVAVRASLDTLRLRRWRQHRHQQRIRNQGYDYHFPRTEYHVHDQQPPAPAPPSPYDILGIAQDATLAEIRTAYKRRALQTHPDKHNVPEAGDSFLAVSDAHARLIDPMMRSEIDAGLFEKSMHNKLTPVQPAQDSIRPRPQSCLWDDPQTKPLSSTPV